MKPRTIVLFVLGSLLLTSLFSCEKNIQPTPTFESKLEERIFTSPALQNNFFGDPAERAMLVYTPKGYDPNGAQRYPVVYLLHGMPFGDSSFVDPRPWTFLPAADRPDFPQQGFKAWVDSLIATDLVHPTIIVMPDAKTKYSFCFYTNSVLQGNYEDFIAEDLVGYMDSHYKTIANRKGRAVIGHSQGGYGAIRMGLMRSDVFGIVASHVSIPFFNGLSSVMPFVVAENPSGMMGPSPDKLLTTITYGMSAAWSPNLNNPPYYVDLAFEYPSGALVPEVWSRWLENDPYTLIDTHIAELNSLKGFYLDAGTADPWMDLTVTFHNKLVSKGIPHYYEPFGGGHFNKMFSRLQASLEYCTNIMY